MRYARNDLVLPIITSFEQGPLGGPATTPYVDPAGYYTIGYGHRCAPTYPTITATQAAVIAEQDIQAASVYLNQSCGPTIIDALSDGQFAALTDFIFNVGAEAFQHSTLHALVMAGRNDLVPGELRKWVYAHIDGKPVVLPGLTARREAEVSLWETGSWGRPAVAAA